MEIEELGKILFFIALLIVIILLVTGMFNKNIDIFEKFKELLFFR